MKGTIFFAAVVAVTAWGGAVTAQNVSSANRVRPTQPVSIATAAASQDPTPTTAPATPTISPQPQPQPAMTGQPGFARPVAPSSSLLVAANAGPSFAAPMRGPSEGGPNVTHVNADVLTLSRTAVEFPKPRLFHVHDLVTIIIREQSTATLESSISTNKDASLNGQVNGLPDVTNLMKLLKGDARIGNQTGSDLPQAGFNANKDFSGDGDYERKDTLITRLTGRIIEIKPNGLLVIEARTNIQNDEEVQNIAVTGYARAEDITADNSVLSTQMYDLRVKKTHEGELRKTTKKGIIPKVFDVLFNF